MRRRFGGGSAERERGAGGGPNAAARGSAHSQSDDERVVHLLQQVLLVMDMFELLHLQDLLLVHALHGEVFLRPPVQHERDRRQSTSPCGTPAPVSQRPDTPSCASGRWFGDALTHLTRRSPHSPRGTWAARHSASRPAPAQRGGLPGRAPSGCSLPPTERPPLNNRQRPSPTVSIRQTLGNLKEPSCPCTTSSCSPPRHLSLFIPICAKRHHECNRQASDS